MTATKLACPKCRRSIPELYWQGVDLVRCPSCETEFEQIRFPAMDMTRQVDVAATSAEGEANCFFHAHNRAEAACDGCGRYMCSVCRVPVGGKQLCPSCLEASGTRRKLPENHRVLHSHICLVMAVVPLIFWPLTVLTAPIVIGWVIYAWKKPGSITGKRGRLSFVLAALIATLQLVGWGILAARLWLR